VVQFVAEHSNSQCPQGTGKYKQALERSYDATQTVCNTCKDSLVLLLKSSTRRHEDRDLPTSALLVSYQHSHKHKPISPLFYYAAALIQSCEFCQAV
jgi:hypothetical protein